MEFLKKHLPLLYLIVSYVLTAATPQAPFIFDVTVTSPVVAVVTWRNNDACSNQYLIYRKKKSDDQFSQIKTVSTPATSFSDSTVWPGYSYIYCLRACCNTDTSGFSNQDTISMPRGLFKTPFIKAQFQASPYQMHIEIIDSSQCEEKTILQRSYNGTDYNDVTIIIPQNPISTTTISIIDSMAIANIWLWYRAVQISDTDTVVSNTVTVFALNPATILAPTDTVLTLKYKLSEMPINFNRWCIKIGDTIFINENIPTDSIISAINISDPYKPVFSGIRNHKLNCPDGRFISGKGDSIAVGITCSGPVMLQYINCQFKDTTIQSSIPNEWSLTFGTHSQRFLPLFSLNDSLILLRNTTSNGYDNYSILVLKNGVAKRINWGIPYSSLAMPKYVGPEYNRSYKGNHFNYSNHEGRYLSWWAGVNIYNYFSGKNVCDSTVKLNDFRRIPDTRNGFAVYDSLLRNANAFFLHKEDSICYIVMDAKLLVYKYELSLGSAFSNGIRPYFQNSLTEHSITLSSVQVKLADNIVTLLFDLQKPGTFSFKIFDLLGNVRWEYFSQYLQPGCHKVNGPTASKLGNGTYIISSTVNSKKFSNKLTIIK